jgi:class 3 adenylate cyclase
VPPKGETPARPAETGAGPAVAGAAVRPGAREADRRHVTVLFADLSGFTALAERLDAEDVRAFQSRLFETLAGVIARYDGFVEKFVGDAVLAVFGAPVAHEDDPERACGAALEMWDSAARSAGSGRRGSASRCGCTSASTPGPWSRATSAALRMQPTR